MIRVVCAHGRSFGYVRGCQVTGIIPAATGSPSCGLRLCRTRLKDQRNAMFSSQLQQEAVTIFSSIMLSLTNQEHQQMQTPRRILLFHSWIHFPDNPAGNVCTKSPAVRSRDPVPGRGHAHLGRSDSGWVCTRNFAIQGGPCGIPPAAVAYSLNVTVVPAGPLGYLTVWPAGQSAADGGSTLNSLDGPGTQRRHCGRRKQRRD